MIKTKDIKIHVIKNIDDDVVKHIHQYENKGYKLDSVEYHTTITNFTTSYHYFRVIMIKQLQVNRKPFPVRAKKSTVANALLAGAYAGVKMGKEIGKCEGKLEAVLDKVKKKMR